MFQEAFYKSFYEDDHCCKLKDVNEKIEALLFMTKMKLQRNLPFVSSLVDTAQKLQKYKDKRAVGSRLPYLHTLSRTGKKIAFWEVEAPAEARRKACRSCCRILSSQFAYWIDVHLAC